MNGLEFAKKVAKLWQAVHPGESAYYQCERISGYYGQWAYQGNENGIKTYGDAWKSGNASTFFISGPHGDRNSSEIKAGDEVFFDIGEFDDVVSVIGRSSSGRVLVMSTSKSGTVVQDLGNHIRIVYLDSIAFNLRGISRAHGANVRRSSLTDYILGGGGQATGSISDLATRTMSGDFGNGAERREALGSNYGAVQDEINRRLNKPKPSVNIDALARAVIAGKHGNGAERRKALGSNYDAVQARVNALLNASSASVRTYTIQRGDSLSSIANRLRYPGGWKALYNKNRGVIGANASVVYAGQVLTL